MGSSKQGGGRESGLFFQTVQNRLSRLEGGMLVPQILGVDDDDRPTVAQVQASGAGNHHVSETAILRFDSEVLEEARGFLFMTDTGGTGGAVTTAHEDMMTGFAHGYGGMGGTAEPTPSDQVSMESLDRIWVM